MYDYKEIETIDQAYEKHPDKTIVSEIKAVLNQLPQSSYVMNLINDLDGEVVTDVINNNDPSVAPFDPNYNDLSQEKWGPWCEGGDASGAGFRVGVGGWTDTHSNAGGGGRLALRDPGRLQHMKKYHPDVYKEYFLVLE